MQVNSTLKVLDLSYNSSGGTGAISQLAAREWSKVFARDAEMELIHLDLSFNNFSREECRLLADGLAQNHSIYGFHFKGNSGADIDSRGFIKLQENV
jgi:hypothetical protein